MPATETLETCSCGATPGANHAAGCDHARCPGCGEQLIGCGDVGCGDERPALWPGVDQRAEVARTLGWWTTAAGIDHLVEDYTRVLFAIGLDQVTWDQGTQRYVIGLIDEATLSQSMARAGV